MLKLLLFTSVLALGSIFSCKVSPEVSPENPCLSIKDADANFEMLTKTGGIEYACDTVLKDNAIFLKALDTKSNHYNWFVDGKILRDTSSKVGFIVDKVGAFDVKLLVRIDRSNCTPEVKDSLEKKIVVLERTKSKFKGHFFGYIDENPEDTLTVFFEQFVSNGMVSIHIKNINRGCLPASYIGNIEIEQNLIPRPLGEVFGFRTLYFGTIGSRYIDSGCEDPEGFAVIDYNNTLTITYTSGIDKRIQHTFKGKPKQL